MGSKRQPQRKMSRGNDPPVAIVSSLPPEQTGIAHFTHRLFAEDSAGFHFYTDRANGHSGSFDPVFSLDELAHRATTDRYAAVVFMVGNSAHSVSAIKAMRALAKVPRPPPILAYLHEAWLLALLEQTIGAEAVSGVLRRVYAGRTAGNGSAPLFPPRELIKQGILGVRALFEDVPLHKIFVNSRTAFDLLRADDPTFPPERIKVLFHPVFAPIASPEVPPRSAPLRIGTFGVPNPYKAIDKVVAAFAQVRASIPQAELVIAGYGARTFTRTRGWLAQPGVQVHDSPPAERFEALMASVDVAVQLRDLSLGESSGTVAQLVALRRPIVVSRVGSLVDLGDAACFAPDRATPPELAALILAEARQPERRSAAMAAYAAAHEPGRLLDLLRQETRPQT
jgi:glycosyltransferase involved in cell wall biosynthesis